MKYRVMQVTETGEAFNVFEGSEDECIEWVENIEGFEESTFQIESANPWFVEDPEYAEEYEY